MKYLIFLVLGLQAMCSFSQSLLDVQISRAYGQLSGEKQILVKSTGFCLSHELSNTKVLLLAGYIFDQGATRRNFSLPLNTFYLEGIRANTWYLGGARRFKLRPESKASMCLGASLHWRKILEGHIINSIKPGGWVEGWVENKISSHPGVALQLFYRVPLLKKLSLECAIQSRFYTQLSGPVHTAGLGLVYTFKKKERE